MRRHLIFLLFAFSSIAATATSYEFLERTSAGVCSQNVSFSGTIDLSGAAALTLDDGGLDDIAALAMTDSNIIVGNGTAWVAESGATARTSLGLAIGTDVQAWDADLDTYAGITPSANVQSLLGAANFAGMKTLLSLDSVENTALSTWAGTANVTTLGTIATGTWQGTVIDHERGGLEADVSAYSGLVKIAGGVTSAVTITTAGEAILDDADAAAQRTTLGLVIGTNVLAQQTIGIANDNLLEIDDATVAAADYAKFTANGIEGKTIAEVKTDLSLTATAEAAVDNATIEINTGTLRVKDAGITVAKLATAARLQTAIMLIDTPTAAPTGSNILNQDAVWGWIAPADATLVSAYVSCDTAISAGDATNHYELNLYDATSAAELLAANVSLVAGVAQYAATLLTADQNADLVAGDKVVLRVDQIDDGSAGPDDLSAATWNVQINYRLR